jgi:hypothetical protein
MVRVNRGWLEIQDRLAHVAAEQRRGLRLRWRFRWIVDTIMKPR